MEQSVERQYRSPLLSEKLPPLLTTNLQVPHLHQELLLRHLLLDKLDLALGVPLTVVLAPPGFGKTTLLSQWIANKKEAGEPMSFAWVSLEDGADLLQFWRYLAAALDRLRPGLGRSVLALLERDQPPINTIVRTLINEITAAAEESILILDD